VRSARLVAIVAWIHIVAGALWLVALAVGLYEGWVESVRTTPLELLFAYVLIGALSNLAAGSLALAGRRSCVWVSTLGAVFFFSRGLAYSVRGEPIWLATLFYSFALMPLYLAYYHGWPGVEARPPTEAAE